MRFLKRKSVQLALLLAVFVVSRLAAYWMGVRFDVTGLTYFYQFIDVPLLKDKALESLLYLHSQPPLFNAFLAVVLHWFPDSYALAFHVFYMALGFGILVLFNEVAQKCGFGVITSLVFTVIFALNPGAILNENWLFYTYWMPFLLLSSALAFMISAKSGSTWAYFGLFLSAAALVFVRASYPLPYFFLVVAGAWVVRKDRVRQIIIGMSIPLVLVLALYAKNLVVFHSFSTSSWGGLNLSRISVMILPKEERQDLVKRGDLSPVALIGPFEAASLSVFGPQKPTGIDVLDQTNKAAGSPNFNHSGYRLASEALLRDSLTAIRLHPRTYLRNVAVAWLFYTGIPWGYGYLSENRAHATFFERIHTVVGLCVGPISLADFLALAAAFGYIYRAVRYRSAVLASPALMLVVFMSVQILYNAITSNFMELGENNRFKFEVQPFLFLVLMFRVKHSSWFQRALASIARRFNAASP